MSIMYKYTRQEVAEILNISTRSVDRYIKAGKLRAEKQGKVVMVSEVDVNNMNGGNSTTHEVIVEKTYSAPKTESKAVSTGKETAALDKIYDDLRTEIKEKDGIIRELSIRVGRAEEVAKNSVSLIDFKKSQFLLEESKEHLSKETEELKETNEKLEKDLKYEKTSNMVLIIFVVFLLILSAGIWFYSI